jgi:alpha,alpha-trehalase
VTPDPPLQRCAFLSDAHTGALVGPDDAVVWLCAPRFDSPPLFAALLDHERGGALRTRVEGGAPAGRSQRPGTLVLDAAWTAPGGRAEVTDALALECPLDAEDVAVRARHVLVRRVRCTEGRVAVAVDVDARPDFGRAAPRWTRAPGCWALEDPAVWLSCTADLEERDGRLTGRAALREGDALVLALGLEGAAAVVDAGGADRMLADTQAAWEQWSARTHYEGVAQPWVAHSAAVLRGLMFDETGALLAAPTTSLPEWPGGTRNWDYRATWPRDAALHVLALLRLGHEREAREYLTFLLHTSAPDDGRMPPMAGLDGGPPDGEEEVEGVRGYLASRPVRVGNEAGGQWQLDTLGHALDAAAGLQAVTGGLTGEDWAVLRRIADACCEVWREPDSGLWEIRGEPRQYTHSKILAWVCLDRAVRLAEELGDGEAPVERWAAERDAVHADVLEHGFDPERGAFTHWYGSDALDASLLRIAAVGFLPGTDPRVLGTIDAIAAELGDGALVHRYDHVASQDGFDDPEAAFVLCSFDLVSALVLAGRRDEARRRFDALLDAAGPLMTFSEMLHEDGRMLGNHPQAFSHLALLDAALNLDAAGDEDALHAWAARQGHAERSG